MHCFDIPTDFNEEPCGLCHRVLHLGIHYPGGTYPEILAEWQGIHDSITSNNKPQSETQPQGQERQDRPNLTAIPGSKQAVEPTVQPDLKAA